MKTEDYLGVALRKQLTGHLPDFAINQKIKDMILHYRKRGMTVSNGRTRTPLIEYFFKLAKKENKSTWTD